MINMLPLEEGERITSMLPVSNYDDDHFIFFATSNGTVKKTPLTAFARPRSVGLRAIELEEDDHLVATAITDGSRDVVLFTSGGKAARFAEAAVRSMGRVSRGVRGIRMPHGKKLIAMVIPEADGTVMAVTENGYGKRTAIEDFPTKGRGTQGVIAIAESARNGALIGACQVHAGEEIMMISDQGTMVRTRVDEVSVLGRNTQGVRVIRLKTGEHLVGLARIQEAEEVAEEAGAES
jgi:DNA gyrase subunit A